MESAGSMENRSLKDGRQRSTSMKGVKWDDLGVALSRVGPRGEP